MSKLTCYQVQENPCRIVPARSERRWMDETDQRFAYRCLPLSIANAMGWELLLPRTITATWSGGDALADITVESPDAPPDAKPVASSHFGHGVLTFHVGYLFRTDPGTGIWARGIPNYPKDGIAPLEGIVETDWLDFTFTMNWKFTRPGTVTFAKDEPFCFITLVNYRALHDVVPEIVPIEDAPDVRAGFERWRDARLDFNARLAAEDPQATGQGWQKWYMRGENASGERPEKGHLSKLKLASPVHKDLKSHAKPS
jgi:hypothetical protein